MDHKNFAKVKDQPCSYIQFGILLSPSCKHLPFISVSRLLCKQLKDSKRADHKFATIDKGKYPYLCLEEHSHCSDLS